MNFSKINYQSFLGQLLRLPLRLIPKGMVLPILQGRLRGRKWIVGAGEHGYWLGSYEMRKRLAFEELIPEGAIVYDIGANVGYYTLLSAELVGEEGKVYAFEPLPRNIDFLRRHVALNHFKQVKIIEAAVSDRIGQTSFDLGASSAMGHISDSGEIDVPLVSLDDLLEAREIRPPDYMKVDVEGAEHDVLKGAIKLLERYHPTLFLDTHQREAHRPTITLLEELGYDFKILDGQSLQVTKELIAYPAEGNKA
ncbi:MAG: FkbM family methyltransferase [Chloroflexota bacterium]|jgi:FkbM family methyltransferase|nr:FkbM family methyltransferase [Chloroflexota bacterium]